MLSGSLVAIVTPMLPGGALDFAALARLIDFHIGQRHLGHRHRRHDRRVAHGQRRRALPVHPGGDRPRGRAHSRHRGHGRQLDRRSDRADAFREGGRRGGVPVGRAVLQQADAGRHVPAFPDDRRSGRPAARAVQRARAARSRTSRTRPCCGWPKFPGIIGIKDATSDLVRAAATCCNRLPAAREFALYSGNDDTALPFMLLGGDGVISVTANVAPRADVARCARPRSPATSRRRARRTRG